MAAINEAMDENMTVEQFLEQQFEVLVTVQYALLNQTNNT